MDRNNQNTIAFEPYAGDLMGLASDENYLVFRWRNKDCKILFSVSRRGDAASCHFASDKAGLRLVKQAIDEFTQFVFFLFDWCTMVLAFVGVDSVGRILKKCSYVPMYYLEDERITVYMRVSDV